MIRQRLASRIASPIPKSILVLTLSFVAAITTALLTGSLAAVPLTLCTSLMVLAIALTRRSAIFPPETANPEKRISLVALFNELPFIDEVVLSAHVKNAWGLELENNEDDESFVAGSKPLFVVKTQHQIYAVNYYDRNYFGNLEEVLDQVTELRLSKIIRSHQAWISIDLVSDSETLDPAYHRAMIGRLMNQITNPDCVALLLPDQMKLLPWDESIEEALQLGDSLETLCPTQPAVVPIDDNDPKLVAAVTMARNRFSQFVTAFESHQRDEDRDESRQFAVKAPVTVAGRTEFMWIATTAIENGVLYGTLDNQPVSLPGLRRGDRVRVAVFKLNDWLYTQDDRSFGGFTTKVITDWVRSQRKLQFKRI